MCIEFQEIVDDPVYAPTHNDGRPTCKRKNYSEFRVNERMRHAGMVSQIHSPI
jgi:hypothetical protein